MKQQSQNVDDEGGFPQVEGHCQKGDTVKLFSYIEENLLLRGRSVSTQILTDIYGINGKDRRSR